MDLTQMTINWLSNKRSKSSICNNVQSSSSNDILFYKPRLFKLTNQLLNDDIPTEIVSDVIEKYNMYIDSCIIYFKSIDTYNIIQEEHNIDNVDNELDLVSNEPVHNDTTTSIDMLMYDIPNKVRPVNYNMNNFVIKKTKSKGVNPPRFKDVKLETSELKYKDCGPDSNILINEDILNEHALDVVLPYKYFIALDDDKI